MSIKKMKELVGRDWARNLPERCRRVGWTQAELAVEAQVSPATVTNIVTARHNPHVAIARRIEEVLSAAERGGSLRVREGRVVHPEGAERMVARADPGEKSRRGEVTVEDAVKVLSKQLGLAPRRINVALLRAMVEVSEEQEGGSQKSEHRERSKEDGERSTEDGGAKIQEGDKQ
jgi:transcriptional regulator with XRE-family HTH domain